MKGGVRSAPVFEIQPDFLSTLTYLFVQSQKVSQNLLGLDGLNLLLPVSRRGAMLLKPSFIIRPTHIRVKCSVRKMSPDDTKPGGFASHRHEGTLESS